MNNLVLCILVGLASMACSKEAKPVAETSSQLTKHVEASQGETDTIVLSQEEYLVRSAPHLIGGIEGILTTHYIRNSVVGRVWSIDRSRNWILPFGYDYPVQVPSSLSSIRSQLTAYFDSLNGPHLLNANKELSWGDSLKISQADSSIYIVFGKGYKIPWPIRTVFSDQKFWSYPVGATLKASQLNDSIQLGAEYFRSLSHPDTIWNIPGKTYFAVDDRAKVFAIKWFMDGHLVSPRQAESIRDEIINRHGEASENDGWTTYLWRSSDEVIVEYARYEPSRKYWVLRTTPEYFDR